MEAKDAVPTPPPPHTTTQRVELLTSCSSTVGTATLPTGSGTRRSCLLDGAFSPTSRSRSPPRTRGDYPPLTTTSPPSNGAHVLSTTTRACPARRARADAHGSPAWGHLFASLPPCKTAGSIHKLSLPGARRVPVRVGTGSLAYVPCCSLVVMCAGGVPGRCRRVYLSIPERGSQIAPTRRTVAPRRRECPLIITPSAPLCVLEPPLGTGPLSHVRDCVFYCYHKLNVRDTHNQRSTNQ